jgi:hypothetical protein
VLHIVSEVSLIRTAFIKRSGVMYVISSEIKHCQYYNFAVSCMANRVGVAAIF